MLETEKVRVCEREGGGRGEIGMRENTWQVLVPLSGMCQTWQGWYSRNFLRITYDRQRDSGYSIQGILKGKYHCTIDLLFDLFGLACFANKTKIVSCQFQTSQTGGQWYVDTPLFSIPWID